MQPWIMDISCLPRNHKSVLDILYTLLHSIFWFVKLCPLSILYIDISTSASYLCNRHPKKMYIRLAFTIFLPLKYVQLLTIFLLMLLRLNLRLPILAIITSSMLVLLGPILLILIVVFFIIFLFSCHYRSMPWDHSPK